jgi:arginase family enzyme
MLVQCFSYWPIARLNCVLLLKVPVTPFDNYVAIDQMQAAYETLLFRPVKTLSADIPGGLKTSTISKDGLDHPRIVTLGGDHTIVRYSKKTTFDSQPFSTHNTLF